MRIVLDTNGLVSALITKETPPDSLYQAREGGRFELVTSGSQLAELARVFDYDNLRHFIRREEADALLATVETVAIVMDDLPQIELSVDPDDNAILATAIANHADLIVTGDKADLLTLKAVHGIPIVTPRAALDRIDRNR